MDILIWILQNCGTQCTPSSGECPKRYFTFDGSGVLMRRTHQRWKINLLSFTEGNFRTKIVRCSLDFWRVGKGYIQTPYSKTPIETTFEDCFGRKSLNMTFDGNRQRFSLKVISVDFFCCFYRFPFKIFFEHVIFEDQLARPVQYARNVMFDLHIIARLDFALLAQRTAGERITPSTFSWGIHIFHSHFMAYPCVVVPSFFWRQGWLKLSSASMLRSGAHKSVSAKPSRTRTAPAESQVGHPNLSQVWDPVLPSQHSFRRTPPPPYLRGNPVLR